MAGERGPNEEEPLSGPGLVDLQVNGYRGFDVNSDDVTSETIVELTRALWREGVTTFLPTIITASEEKIRHCLDAVGRARRSDPLVAHSIAGVHVEGPFIAAADGPRGAHDASHVRPPDLEELRHWQESSEGLVRIVTVAPELPGAIEFTSAASDMGVHVSIGHCAPSAEQVRAAVRAGAVSSTHLGNGAHPMLPRHPNHIWAQLASDELIAMLIADGRHLPADTLTVMIRAKTPRKCILTSDSAALAGLPPGEYATPVGGSVTVEPGGGLSLTGTSLLAGSGRSLRECVNWAYEFLPFSSQEILTMATLNPARMIGAASRVEATGDIVSTYDGVPVSVRVAGVEVCTGE